MSLEALPTRKLRWGILGTGRIVRRNWHAMLESNAAELVAVASRDRDRAKALIDGLQSIAPWQQAPEEIGSYDELLQRKDIDAVYIPLPTGLRKEWVLKAAEARKHILCEKPCASSIADLAAMTQACTRNQVLFMDGVMFMHDPRYERLKEVLKDGTSVGQLRRITSAFSFLPGDDFEANDIRANVAMEPAGCLGDLGWYCIRAALWAMDWEMPIRVTCRHLEHGKLPAESEPILSASADLDFSDGTTVSFYCSFRAAGEAWLHLSGTKGNVRMDDFVIPQTDNPNAFEVGFKPVLKSEFSGPSNAARMFARFAHDLFAGSSETQWHLIALKTQTVLDACVNSARTGSIEVVNEKRRSKTQES